MTKTVSAEQMEISRVRAELARVKMERDILKKATAYFVVAQDDVRVLRQKSWQKFRENRGQKRVELAAICTVSDHPLAHAECVVTPRVIREIQMKTPN